MRPGAHNRISRYDLVSLLRAIPTIVGANPYPTPAIFRAAVEGVAGVFLRGAGRRFTVSAMAEIINEITAYADGRDDEAAKWWTAWVGRATSQARESQPAPSRRRRLFPISLRSGTYSITADAELMATGIGQEVLILGEHNRFQIYVSPVEAREFAIGLLDALNKLEVEQGVIEVDQIPSDYSDTAVEDWDEDVRWGRINGGDHQDG